MTEVAIAPSILNSDFLQLGNEIARLEQAGIRRLQIDVMDGRFVPNISVGVPVVEAVRSATGMLIEAHLMIVEPERYVRDFARAGADLIIVHQEATHQLYRTLEQIHEMGKLAGVALNPATPPVVVSEVLSLADLVLVMTVSPGFGGQKFIAGMLSKVAVLRRQLDHAGLETEIEVDGGIDEQTAPRVVAAGARVLVAGTAIFRSPEGVVRAVERLRGAAASGLSENVRK